jgi:hypothetical protein
MKIDIWWKAVLVLGVLSIASAMSFEINFIENKHLFGLGLGMILIGISFWMAWKTASAIDNGRLWSTKIIDHNIVSIIILILGIGLSILFGFLIVRELI